jgi:hypothetical protein
MNVKTRFFLGSALLFAAALALAAPRAVYRIALRDGTTILAQDRPHASGSVMLFHRYPGGKLTSVPREEIAGMTMSAAAPREDTATVAAAATHPGGPAMLQPGEVIVLGPTAPAQVSAPAAAPSRSAPAMVSGGVYDPRIPGYGGYSRAPGVATPVSPGDLPRALSAEPPTLEPTIGSNGFPAAPGASTPLIGSDGRPILAPAGAPGSAQPVISPNGTPVMAAPGAPGSTPPVIGPNGMPVLAPAGAPGSTPPSTGSNGYPAAPAPGK